MSKHIITLELPLSELRAAAICTEVVAGLGWDIASEGNALRAYEDPARLPCHCQPAEAVLTFGEAAGGRTSLTIAAAVPGFGPISKAHVLGQGDILARSIGLAAIAESRGQVQ